MVNTKAAMATKSASKAKAERFLYTMDNGAAESDAEVLGLIHWFDYVSL